jgi:hypothetical protein
MKAYGKPRFTLSAYSSVGRHLFDENNHSIGLLCCIVRKRNTSGAAKNRAWKKSERRRSAIGACLREV